MRQAGDKIARRFYSVFNDTSYKNITAVMAVTVVIPGIAAGIALDRDPATESGPQGAARAASYGAEIKAIVAAVPKEIYRSGQNDGGERAHLSAEARQNLQRQAEKAQNLATRITYDAQLSEKQVEDLSSTLLTSFGRGNLSDVLGENVYRQYRNLYVGASYLQETRSALPSAPQSDSAAREIQIKAMNEEANAYIGLCWYPFLALFGVSIIFGEAALKRGTKKNELFRQQDRNEDFARAHAELENALKPAAAKPPTP